MSFRLSHLLGVALSGLFILMLLTLSAAHAHSVPPSSLSKTTAGAVGAATFGHASGMNAERSAVRLAASHDPMPSPCPGHAGTGRSPHGGGASCPACCACPPLAGNLPAASLSGRAERVTVLRFEPTAAISPAGFRVTPALPPPRTAV